MLKPENYGALESNAENNGVLASNAGSNDVLECKIEWQISVETDSKDPQMIFSSGSEGTLMINYVKVMNTTYIIVYLLIQQMCLWNHSNGRVLCQLS